MARVRSNRDRLYQIRRWLSAVFRTPYPVALRCVKRIAPDNDNELVHGETYRWGRHIVIRIAVRPGVILHNAVDSLLHEWAHAVSMRHDAIEEKRLNHGAHDDEWGLAYGKIYRRFYDEGGDQDSEAY